MPNRNYPAMAKRYAQDVVKGRISVCRWVRLACQRQLRDLDRARHDKRYPYRFDPPAASAICEFLEGLRHIKGPLAGELIVLEPWQIFTWTTIFGWLIKASKTRRFRRVYFEIPRGNSKTTMLAGVGLKLVSADDEGGAEVYSAATKRDQAKILFGVAREMARKDDELCEELGIQVDTHALLVPESASKFEALSADAQGLDGLNIHGGLIDELHAHPTRKVYDVLETGCGKRSQSLLIAITTAGIDRSGICYEQHLYLKKVLEGVELEDPPVVDEQFFGIIYTIDDADDWREPAVWRKANPNWGISVEPSYVEQLARKAMQVPSAVNNFLTKHLNVWVNASSAWMDMRKWEACADKTLRLEDFAGLPCIIGADLASRTDIASLCFLFADARLRDDGKPVYTAFFRRYCPEERADNVQDRYAGWVREGRMIATPGEAIDLERIQEDVLEVGTQVQLVEFAFDPWQTTQMAQKLASQGVTTVEYRNTVQNFSPPMKELDALVREGRFRYDGDPVLTWMVSNVVARMDAKENIYPRKERPEYKIDDITALLTALGRWMHTEPPKPSVYETRGMIALG